MSASPSPEAPPVEDRSSARPLLILLIALCTLMIVTYAARLDERDGVQEAIVAQQTLNDEAQARTASLQKELLSVNRPSYVDEMARTELGMGKPGDVVIVAVAPPGGAAVNAAQPPATQGPGAPRPVWRQWIDLFAPDS